MNVRVVDLQLRQDSRGHLFEVIRKNPSMPRAEFGLIYYNVVKPGITKGNHYHIRKTEWYCVVQGQAKVMLLDRATKERAEVVLSAEKPQLIRLDRNVSHNITNIGSAEMHFIGYIDEPYETGDPDTFPEEVK